MAKKSIAKMRELANTLVKPTAAEKRGACIITFDDGSKPFCHNGMTDTECQNLADQLNGDAMPVTPGSACSG